MSSKQAQLGVTHIIDHMGLGGVQTFLASMLPALRDYGIAPSVINLRTPSDLSESLVRDGVPVVSLKRQRWDLRQIVDIQMTLHMLHPSIAHTHLTAGKLIGRFAAIRAKVPHIILDDQLSVSQDVYSVPPAVVLMYRLLEPYFAHATDLYVTPSQRVLEASQPAKRWPAARCRVIPNAIDTQRFVPCDNRSLARQILGLPDRITVATFGRMVKQKRLDDVILVAQRVLAAGCNVQFLIAGHGPLKEQLERQIAASGLGERIMLLGYRSDTERLLAASDLYLSTSGGEALSLAILEALASGCVIIGTHAGGTEEQVKVGETGFLSHVGDIPSMAQAIIELVAERERCLSMSKAARIDAVTRFSIPAVAQQLAQTYHELIEEQSYANL